MFRFLYKLTDFGSAREFDENELSTSVYGTEEYLVSSFIYFGFARINLLCIWLYWQASTLDDVE